MKNLVIERLRDAVRDAYPPGRTTVRTVDLEWLLAQVDPPKKKKERDLEPDYAFGSCDGYGPPK